MARDETVGLVWVAIVAILIGAALKSTEIKELANAGSTIFYLGFIIFAIVILKILADIVQRIG